MKNDNVIITGKMSRTRKTVHGTKTESERNRKSQKLKNFKSNRKVENQKNENFDKITRKSPDNIGRVYNFEFSFRKKAKFSNR